MGQDGKAKKKHKGKAVLAIAAALAACLAVAVLAWVVDAAKERSLLERRGQVSIVVFGDSIWDICRDGTGIAAVLEQRLPGAKVTNCAMMGTSAAYRTVPDEADEETRQETMQWNQKSLMGLLEEGRMQEVVSECTPVEDVPLEEADYVVLAYGLNDYFCAIPRQSEDDRDAYTYAGALRLAVEWLQNKVPQAKIFLLSQTYCQGYSYGKVDSESDYKDYGAGTGPDYVESARKVAQEMGCVFVNNYEDLGINLRTGPKYLSDATHLTEYGRRKYAENLAEYFLREYKEELKD